MSITTHVLTVIALAISPLVASIPTDAPVSTHTDTAVIHVIPSSHASAGLSK